MTEPSKILSDIIVHMKYARYLPELKRRETWEELCERNMNMHIKKYPELKELIAHTYENYVVPKKVLPSMRSLQFGGTPIEVSPNRIFNCAYLPVDSTDAFSETMFLLLGGTGVGYSVQSHHVAHLPDVIGCSRYTRRYLVGDSIEGWADAVKVLCEAYFYGKYKPIFDFSDIRPKGAQLVTSGGKAPGPQPLKDCIHALEGILEAAKGRPLSALEVHDIMCHIADAVLAGGIRRAALISLFDIDDNDMLTCKYGKWYETNPQRGRANNSAVIIRHKITKDLWDSTWEKVVHSGSGEPGFYFSNDKDYGANPCCEIALRPFQFCNLTEVNVSDVTGQQDLNDRAAAAAIIGTLQAGYTDFHYLRPCWREETERDALVGVGMTGIGSGKVLSLDLEEAARKVTETNKAVAKEIGINPASRTTTIKPSGTSSLVLGCSSGIHAWHNDYYIRRVSVGKDESIYSYLIKNHPELVEDDYFRPHAAAKIEVPQAAPEGSILRHESALSLLERVRLFNEKWVRAGHNKGDNSNNVSCTISVKEDEWADVGEWMWKNRYGFNGIAVMPYSGVSYPQDPFEDIDKERYDSMIKHLTDIDLTQVIEETDETDLTGEIACGAEGCTIT